MFLVCRSGVHLLKRAARRGNPEAQHNLGVVYLNGVGCVRPDERRAFRYEIDIGCLVSVYVPDGIICSPSCSCRYFKEAATLGYVPSMYNVAAFYQGGLGGLKKGAAAKKNHCWSSFKICYWFP